MNANDPATQQEPPSRPVLVWDMPTRLFHWLVVVLVAAAYVTSKLNWMDWHVRIGETLLALVVFRLLWGFFGSETARFHNFLSAPAAAWRYLRHVFHREADLQVGHNSAGGWMVVLLLALLLGETLTGLYVNNDVAGDGPLTQWVPAAIANAITALHTILWDVLLAAVVLHVLAIAVYAIAKGHNLLRPMLTGRKRLPERIRAPRQASVILALLLMVVSATAATLLATYL
ncbi:cytochrome b/b6 domain-containing protein [Caballeronia sp. LjRoot29]|uniref:cytochrome b/b6 domain-containing protein n=1 Tax=Caballeronia sp. LjRoot29 TaxID=3342315 RepID=UPI003ECFB321